MIRLSFEFSPAKFVETIGHLLSRVGPCTRLKLTKLLYLADRCHVIRHGTPILGDRYYRLPHGPVPSRALDLLEAAADLTANDPEVTKDVICDDLLQRILVRNPESKQAEYACERPSPPQALSPAEMKTIDEVAAKYGPKSAVELRDLTHKHYSWTHTPASAEIDYRTFFVNEPEAREEALRYLEYSQADRDLIEGL